MKFDGLLSAIEEYVEAKKMLDTSRTAPCADWDCGLAVEFDGPLMPESLRDRFEKARAGLEDALNGYVDSRVTEVLRLRQGRG